MSLNIVIPLNDSVVDLSPSEFRRHFKSSNGKLTPPLERHPMIFARGRSYRRVGPGLTFHPTA